jgi:hypothetical protein
MKRAAIPIANPITDSKLANDVKLLEAGDRKWRYDTVLINDIFLSNVIQT